MMVKKLGFKTCILAVILLIYTSIASSQILEVVNNGSTTYVITLSSTAPSSVHKAAKDLAYYIEKQTGASLKIVKDEIPSQPYISIGDNAAFKAAKLDYKGLEADGYKIITKGNNIFIYGIDTPDGKINNLGGRGDGTANGIYSFIEKFTGIRWLMPGEMGEYIPKTKDLFVEPLNLTNNPGLLLRNVPYIGNGELVRTWENRLKLGKVTAPEYNHAWEETIPASLYDKHPDYFAKIDGKHQPPAERHKLETTNPALVQAYADVIIKHFDEDPNKRWYSLSPSDGVNGEQGWSNSPESKALTELDPNGKLSKTPLILKFYNDVAKIVKEKYPERKLGGYIYANYLYPPKEGIKEVQPNLGFMLAFSPAYGFQLYRESTQKNWIDVIDAWGRASNKSGNELYYYDLPTAMMQHNGVIQPPAPDILNFIFHKLDDYKFLGTRFYGRPVWPVFGPMNYAIVKMCWDPSLDAHNILEDYYIKAYGTEAAPHISKLYHTIDSAYKIFYEKHPEKSWNLSTDHWKEIYVPLYSILESHMLLALANKPQDAKQLYRLEQFGKVFSLMEWTIRDQGFFKSPQVRKMALTDQDIDRIIFENDKANKELPVIDNEFVLKAPAKSYDIKVEKELDKSNKKAFMATSSNAQLLIYSPNGGDIEVNIRRFDGVAELVRYNIYTQEGSLIGAGTMSQGKKITIPSMKGQYYYFDIVNRRAIIQYDIKNGIEAFNTNRDSGKGFRLDLSDLQTKELPVYFYNNSDKTPFGIIMSFGLGLEADVYAPDGKLVDKLSTIETQSDRYLSPEGMSSKGFWKVVVKKPNDYKNKTVSFTLDKGLPQWAQSGRNGFIVID